MLRLNFHHLYYFYVIAEQGQVARAARRLRIGQPTLSTQLKQFEDFLGYRLFDRKRGQALALTPHGEILLAYAKRIFQLSEEMLASANSLKAVGRLRLRLGVLDWLPKREINDLIMLVRRNFDCFVSVFEDTSNQLVRMLTDQDLDVIVTNAPPPHQEDRPVRAHRIRLLPVLICGAPGFARLKPGFPASLQGQPMVLPTYHGKTRHAIDDYFRTRNIVVKAVGEAQDGELLRLAAMSGEVLAPLSPSTVSAELEHGELTQIGALEGVFEELWLSSVPRLVEHPAVSFLMARFGLESAA